MKQNASPLFRGCDIRHTDGRTARVVAIESAQVHARLWWPGWVFPGDLVTWRRADVVPISAPAEFEEALL